MKTSFNKSVVQTLPVGSHQDLKCPGLTLTVTEHSRRFSVYISVKSMPTRKSIGPIEEWSVEAARIRAGEIIRELRQAADKPKTPTMPTLQELADSYTRKLEIEGKRDTTYIANAMRLYLAPFASRKVDTLNKQELQDEHDNIADSRGKSAAARAIMVARMLLNYAIDDDYISRNVASRVTIYPDVSRDVFLNEQEIGVFREALAEIGGDIQDYFLVILNVGLRKSNAAGLRWEWIDGDTLTVPASASKNKSEMVIPLTAEAMSILKRREGNGSEFVFPGRADGKPIQEVWGWLMRVRAEAVKKGLMKPFSIHDIRRSAASLLGAKGASLPVVAKFLGHKSLHTVSTYMRADVGDVRAALARV